jgi:hypothetical protein
MRIRNRLSKREHGIFVLRCLAIMQGKGHAFGFQLGARQVGQRSREPLLERLRECVGSETICV